MSDFDHHVAVMSSLIVAMAARKELNARVNALEERHRDVRLGIRVSFDLQPANWGASMFVLPTRRRMEWFGAPTAQHIVTKIEEFCASDAFTDWLKEDTP